MPVLSVLTAGQGKRARFLVEAGEGLADQALPDGWELEWVVQEDGADPRLAETIEQFPFAKYGANGEQLGVALTRNLALARVSGELVHMLDSDDLLLPGGLAAAVAVLAGDRRLHWVAGPADDLLPDGSRRSVALPIEPGFVDAGVVSELIVEERPLPIHPAGLTIRTATLRALGGWIGSPYSEDNAMMIALTDLTPGYLLKDITWLYRRHDGQNTAQPDFDRLQPICWAVVRQRLAALREVGLRLRDE
jgi:glycosyltransferase involved in cell wall biosynthesis